jgi:hypothetical protein
MKNEEFLIVHEKKKKEFKEFVDSFSKELVGIFNMQEDALWEQAEFQGKYLATIAELIRLFGEDNKVTVFPEQLELVKDTKFYIKVDSNEEDGSITYSLIFEEDEDAESNSGEDTQDEVQP